MMTDLGVSIDGREFMVGHVSELVQFQLVRLIHLVSVMDMYIYKYCSAADKAEIVHLRGFGRCIT